MSTIDELYPQDCAFCKISNAYSPGTSSPIPESPDPQKILPQCQLLLSTPHVLAFLDIMPIAPAHILLTTRDHYTKLSDLHSPSRSSQAETSDAQQSRESARALGEWLPILSRALCRATGVEDWNIVQNNGARAAQVVPHVHFHLIPRYQEGRKEGARNGRVDMGMLRSWTMFGRGPRDDLDEEEGAELAGVLREALREELGEEMREGGKSRL